MRMRHIFMAVACMCHASMWSQDCLTNATGISTNPDASVNPQCPGNVVFDWRQDDYPYKGNPPGLPPVEFEISSPFSNETNVLYPMLWDVEEGGGDYLPADGWELIQPGVYTHNPDIINYNYVVLYNRYTSIMRVVFFLSRTLGDDYSFVVVKLRFRSSTEPGSVSALLHPRTGISQPMDQFSVAESQATVLYTNKDYDFMYADFPVEYDPCTCLQNNATIDILFEKVGNQKLELYGRVVDVQRSLANIQDFGGFLDRDFLTQTYATSQFRHDIGGSHTFNTYDGLVAHYDYLKSEQAELKGKYEFFKIFNELVKTAGGVGAPILKGVKLKGKKEVEDAKNKIFGIGYNLELDLTGALLLEGMAGFVNLFGAPIKNKLDAVTGQVNALGATMFGHGEIALSGDISNTIAIGSGATFRLPGRSVYNCESLQYPFYNETLGRFALLETPTVNSQVYYENLTDPIGGGITTLSAIRFRIDAPSLKYVFNPAANVDKDKTEIWAALRYSLDGSEPISSPLVPLECLESLVLGASAVHAGFLPPFSLNVELVLMVDFIFDAINSEGNPHQALAIYTYPVNISTDFVSSYSDPQFWPITSDYPYDLTIETTEFIESQTIFAWSNITIIGDLTTQPGVKVEIVAPNIQVLDESFIGSDIWLRDGYVPFASCEPLGEYPSSLLAAYCSGTKYKANQSLAPPPDEEALAQPPAPVPPAPGASLAALQVEAYPNPLSGYATLRLLLPEEGAVSASLSDLQGRPLRQVLPAGYLPAGEHLFDLPAHDLAPGMYLLTVQTAQGRKSIKLVKR